MTGTLGEVKEPEPLLFLAVAEDHAGNTPLTLHAKAAGLTPVSQRMLSGIEAGWTQSLERLEKLVPDARQ